MRRRFELATCFISPVRLGRGDAGSDWTLSGSTSVPDAAGTFQLFVGALTALGTYEVFLRGRRRVVVLRPKSNRP